MNKARNKEQKERWGFRWKILMGLLVLLLVGLILSILSINSIARHQINKALERLLTQGSTLDNIDIQLIGGCVKLGGLTINPPKGYGTYPLLSLNTLELVVDPISLFGDEIVVERLNLRGLSLVLVRDKHGKLSLIKLVPSVDKAFESEPIDDRKEQKQLSVPAIRVNSIHFENLSVRLVDQQLGEHWSAGVQLDLAADNLQIKDLLNQEILVGKVNLALSGIKIDQPEGFSQKPLLAVDKIELAATGFELGAPRLNVSKVVLNNLVASIERNRNGVTNLQRLNETFLGKMEETSKSKRQPEAETGKSTHKKLLPAILFEQIRMEGGSINFRDEALTEETLVIPMVDMRMEVTQLHLFEDNKKTEPASASMSFKLKQPGDLPDAFWGSVAAIGPVGSGVTAINSQVRLTGFKLDILGSLAPSATRTTLGADGFDASLVLALDNGRIKLQSSIVTDKNIQYNAVKVWGSLNAPNVKVEPVLSGVYNRISGGMLGLGKGSLRAGFGIAKGGVETTQELASGALKIGKNIGENLFKTGTGLVTLNRQKLEEGLMGSTKGTVDFTLDSVEGAGSAAGAGLKGSVEDLKGDTALKAWDKGIPVRYRAAMQQAKEALARMHYPPATD